jgi:hypothetical protein
MQRILLDNSGFTQKSAESLTPSKLPPIEKNPLDHSNLVRSTRVIRGLVLVTSRENSPLKDFSNSNSNSNLEHLSDIVSSCDVISKINKSDLILAESLEKQRKDVFDRAEEFLKEQALGNEVSRWAYRFNKRKVGKMSIEKIKKESFETAYYVEKVLNKDNSSKKLKEKVMPWKKILLYG